MADSTNGSVSVSAQPGEQTQSASDVQAPSASRFITALAIVLILLVILNRTEMGHVVVYYLLLLNIVTMLLIQHNAFAKALEPLTGNLAPPSTATPGGGLGQ